MRSNTPVRLWALPFASLLLVCSSCDEQRISPVLEVARGYFPTAVRIQEPASGRSGPLQERFQVVQSRSGVLGYIVDEQVVSRSGPFSIRVVMDRTFCVLHAKVLSYTGDRGRAVRKRMFTRQFEGKGPDDPIRLGTDIDAISGATLSSASMSGGVRRAIRRARKVALEANALASERRLGHDSGL